jgi:uncharacterized protein YlxW (UPF0749 family)
MLASEVLEFNLIKEYLSNTSKMEINKDRFLELDLINDKEIVEHMLKQVAIAGKTAEISMAGLLATTGVFIAVAAGIAGIAYGLTVAADAYNADPNAAKRATEASDNLAESASKVKQEFADLQNSINTYDEAIKALEDCKTGTD